MTKPLLKPIKGFLRLPQVLELIPMGKSTWWRGVASGKFPSPVKISPHISLWKVEDVEKIIQELNGIKNG